MENAIFLGYDNIFSIRLRELMKETNTKQHELAKAVKTTRQAIQQYCDGSSQPNITKLLAIAKYFDVSADYLLGETSVKRNDNPELKTVCDYTGLSEKAVEALRYSKSKNNLKCIVLNYLIEKSKNKEDCLLNNICLYFLSDYFCNYNDIAEDYLLPKKKYLLNLYDEDIVFSKIIRKLPLSKESFIKSNEGTTEDYIHSVIAPMIIDYNKCERILNDYYNPGLNDYLDELYYQEHIEEIELDRAEEPEIDENLQDTIDYENYSIFDQQRAEIIEMLLYDHNKISKDGDTNGNS